MSELIKIPVVSFRKIESPYDADRKKSYVSVMCVKNVPEELDSWRVINPREAKLNSGVSKKILDSLTSEPSGFLFKNRGITLLVESASYDNKEGLLSIELSEKNKHGILDGGHTYKVIRSLIDNLEGNLDEIMAYVKIEILEGFADLEEAVAIVEARNTSTQVKEESLEELRGHYDLIKKTFSSLPYADMVAYKENELLEDGTKKTIDIKDILSYLVCFDTDEYNENQHPTKAYSSKSSAVKHFRDHHESIKKFIPLLPEILKLWDTIYKDMPDTYNNQGGKFGGLMGVIEVSNKNRMSYTELPFTGAKSSYRIPLGFIYPVLAAFRNLVDRKDEKCYWKADPVKFYLSIKDEIVQRIVEHAKQLRNPQRLGKELTVWRSCYDCVQLEVLKRNI